MQKKILEDSEGNKSSKRLFGSILISLGSALHITLFIFSLLKKAVDPVTALGIANNLIYVGATLLGVGVVENLMKKDKK